MPHAVLFVVCYRYCVYGLKKMEVLEYSERSFVKQGKKLVFQNEPFCVDFNGWRGSLISKSLPLFCILVKVSATDLPANYPTVMKKYWKHYLLLQTLLLPFMRVFWRAQTAEFRITFENQNSSIRVCFEPSIKKLPTSVE
jgi:hypothetical protein